MVRSIDIKKDMFRPKEYNKQLFCHKAPCLSAIRTLMYLAN